MTEIHQSQPQLPSSSSSTRGDNDGFLQQTHMEEDQQYSLINTPPPNSYCVAVRSGNTEEEEEEEERVCVSRERKRREREEEGDQLSLLAALVTVFRKSLVGCSSERFFQEFSSFSSSSNKTSMEIGVPTNVRHVAHVTFDRFNGFLGLPVEFEPDVPRRPPSASTSVFGVSTESMQLSFDSRGNSVPTILLMMQRRLYAQGGLQAEGIFRINGENGQEEYVREQLNKGEVPENIDVHCLAGLIKAWFRELPTGVLDSLAPEQVMQAQSEEECARLMRLLPPTETSLMDWAINLMADVAQLEHLNKMNARNVAMVFAPNMTQMADPLTALMYAVQVMNFLKTLIVKTLRDREDAIVEPGPASRSEPSDENEHHRSSQLPIVEASSEESKEDLIFFSKEPVSETTAHPSQSHAKTKNETHGFLHSIENIFQAGKGHVVDDCPCEIPDQVESVGDGLEEDGANESNGGLEVNTHKTRTAHSSNSNYKKGSRKVRAGVHADKSRGATIVSRVNSRTERIEAWR